MKRESRRRRRREEEYDEDELDEQEYEERESRRAPARKRKRRWPMRLLFLMILMGVGLWFVPTLVTKTPALQQALNYGTAKMKGSVVAGSASLGWFSPVQVSNVVLYDADKKPVVTVANLQSQKSLFGLITNSKKPGVMRLEKPKLFLVLRENGSNLEDIFLPLMDKPAAKSSSGGKVEVGVDIVEGSAEIVDATTNRKWIADDLSVSLRMSADPTQPLDAKVRGVIRPDTGNGGGLLSADVLWKAATEPGANPLGEGKASLQGKTLPLAFLQPLLKRFAGDYVVEGALSADAQYEWRLGANKSDVTHSVAVNNLIGNQLVLLAPQLLGRDALKMAQLSIAGQAALVNNQVEFKKMAIHSDVAHVEANGTVSLTNLIGKSGTGALLALLQKDDFQVSGELDLAQLAKLLPSTLHVREGTQITSGKISASLVSQQKGNRRQWDGKIESTQLAAMNQGQPVRWDKPIDVTLTAYDSPQGPVIDQLVCDSSFLRLQGRGTLDQGDIGVQGNLGQLATELDRFVDLGNAQLAGNLQGKLNWKRQGGEQVSGEGEIVLRDFALAMNGVRPWQEKQLVISLGAAGTADQTTLRRIETASIEVQSGNDRMKADLTKPVANPSAQSLWPFQTHVVGDLATWLPRVQALFPLNGWNIAGTFELTETGALSPTEVLVENAQLKVENLRAFGSGLFLDEPLVRTEIQDAAINLANSQVTAKTMTIASSAVAMRADSVTVQPGASGTSVNAAVGFRSDLSRISHWITDPSKPVASQFAGQAQGQIRVALAGDNMDAQLDIDVVDFVYAALAPSVPGGPPAGLKPAWQEPNLKFTGKGGYQANKDTFLLSDFRVVGSSLNVIANGAVTEPAQRCLVDLKGEIGYDLQVAAVMLRPYLGDSFNITGRDQRPFVMKGPLRDVTTKAQTGSFSQLASLPRRANSAAETPVAWPPAELTAQFGLSWKTADAYGLPIGPGELQTTLANRVIQMNPLELPVSEGHLRLATQVRLDREPYLIVAEKGTLLDKVRISPEICSQWLKYVTPIVADVTQVDGRFSVGLADAAVIPTSDPLGGEVRGDVAIHNAQVGPGPLAQEVVSLATAVRAIIEKRPFDLTGANSQRQWINLPEQKIPFHWKDRRVYHEGLQMVIGDVVIRTKGSVGVDQSLDMLAEIPIRDEWVQRDKAFSTAMQGQVIQIPIGGTVSKPRVDRGALQQFTKQAVTNAAGKLLDEQLNRGLDKLLRPRTNP